MSRYDPPLEETQGKRNELLLRPPGGTPATPPPSYGDDDNLHGTHLSTRTALKTSAVPPLYTHGMMPFNKS